MGTGGMGTAGALPRIEVVEVPGGEGYFQVNGTMQRFVPRGVNYIRLTKYHSTFDTGQYDAIAVEAALGAIEGDGYNVVRVFIDPGDWTYAGGINGPMDTAGLSGPYLDNVADFLERASAHHLYVIPSLDLFPFNQHYLAMSLPDDPDLVSFNAYHLHEGHIAAKEAYVTDWIAGLTARIGKAKLSTILAHGIENEAAYDAQYPPFSMSSGTVKTADGGTYDMAVASQRQQAADANDVNFANRIAKAIRAADPEALVTMGMFTYRAVGRTGPTGLLPVPTTGESRFPTRPAVLRAYSDLSFLDVHTYPRNLGAPWPPVYTLADDLATSEWSMVDRSRPIVMGEFGAYKDAPSFPALNDAVPAMRAHQVDSCNYGFGGWLFWTFDTTEQPELWNLRDGNGAIDAVLAPKVRPDPCAP
jgi:hypothetical protein